jgi:hypothetical protein
MDSLSRPLSFRSIMRSKTGELERSDFDTFDPSYYPFLAKPIAPDAQTGTCVSKSALDLPTLVRGGQIATWIWSDGGSVGAIFRPEENEKLTVPAGSFDALRVPFLLLKRRRADPARSQSKPDFRHTVCGPLPSPCARPAPTAVYSVCSCTDTQSGGPHRIAPSAK